MYNRKMKMYFTSQVHKLHTGQRQGHRVEVLWEPLTSVFVKSSFQVQVHGWPSTSTTRESNKKTEIKCVKFSLCCIFTSHLRGGLHFNSLIFFFIIIHSIVVHKFLN